jgi:hypothetical protein
MGGDGSLGTAEELAAAFGDEVIARVREDMVKAPVVLASDLAAFHSDGRCVDGEDGPRNGRSARVVVRVPAGVSG